MYTIGKISEMSGLPISTLRYYDRKGLFPDIKRTSGIRQFDERQVEVLHIIECLKLSGLEIKDIKTFMEWCAEGSATYGKRLALFEKQKKAVESEIARLEQVLAMIRFKCWYYEQAIADGNEDRLEKMMAEGLPSEVQALYDKGHGKIRE